MVKPASSLARAGLRLRPQINDRDARDKITSRIKERRYVPITSTYLRDRSISPRRPRISRSLFSLVSHREDTTRSVGPDPPTGETGRIPSRPRSSITALPSPQGSNYDTAFILLYCLEILIDTFLTLNGRELISPHAESESRFRFAHV